GSTFSLTMCAAIPYVTRSAACVSGCARSSRRVTELLRRTGSIGCTAVLAWQTRPIVPSRGQAAPLLRPEHRIPGPTDRLPNPPADPVPRPADRPSNPADAAPLQADRLPNPADRASRLADRLPNPADPVPRPEDRPLNPADRVGGSTSSRTPAVSLTLSSWPSLGRCAG